MMSRTILAFVPTLLWSGVASAQDKGTAIACETLLAARRIDAASGAERQAGSEAGCRSVDRAAVGAVEQRALIGGAPYECMTIRGGGRCLWIVP